MNRIREDISKYVGGRKSRRNEDWTILFHYGKTYSRSPYLGKIMNRAEKEVLLEAILYGFTSINEELSLTDKEREHYLQNGLEELQEKLERRIHVHSTINIIDQRCIKIRWIRTFKYNQIFVEDLEGYIQVLETQEKFYEIFRFIGIEGENNTLANQIQYPITREWIDDIRHALWLSKTKKERNRLMKNEIKKANKALSKLNEKHTFTKESLRRFLHDGTNICREYVQSRQDVHALLDTLEERAQIIGWNIQFTERAQMSMIDVQKEEAIIAEQEELFRPIQQLGFACIPKWVKEELSFPLDKDKLKNLVERYEFDTKWRLHIEEEISLMDPELRKTLPAVPAEITPSNLTPILHAFKSIQDDFIHSIRRSYTSFSKWIGITQDSWKIKKIRLSNHMSMVEIPTGTYNSKGKNNIHPKDIEIKVEKFWLCTVPCTQNLYGAVMNRNPSTFLGKDIPVQGVSWCDAILFCNRLSILENLEPAYIIPENFSNDAKIALQVRRKINSNGYRLPTLYEWMYAVRGRDNYLYSGGDVFHEIGWFAPNSGGKAHPVEQKKCNVWGLYDMNGNVFEWVWHIKLDEPKRESKNIFKKNPHLYTKVEIIPNSHFRYTIGGSCRSNPYVHTINKSYSTYSKLPNQRFLDTGFRLARTKLT